MNQSRRPVAQALRVSLLFGFSVLILAIIIWSLYFPPVNIGRERSIERRYRYNRLQIIRIALMDAEKQRGKPISSVETISGKEISWRVMILPYLDKPAIYRVVMKDPIDRESRQRIAAFDFYRTQNGHRESADQSALVAVAAKPRPLEIRPEKESRVPNQGKNRQPVIVDLGSPLVFWPSPRDVSKQDLKAHLEQDPKKVVVVLWSDGTVQEGPITDGTTRFLKAISRVRFADHFYLPDLY